jgi:hypothetical protein
MSKAAENMEMIQDQLDVLVDEYRDAKQSLRYYDGEIERLLAVQAELLTLEPSRPAPSPRVKDPHNASKFSGRF